MKYIPLTQGKHTLVDDEDYEYLSQWKWYYNKGYACRNKFHNTEGEGVIDMHIVIITPPKGYYIDHINTDSLDNRRNNLRICTKSQNGANSKKQKGTTSKYKGVSWDKSRNKWVVGIMQNYKKIFIGRYKTEKEAALAYNKKASELFNEFARLNNID